MIIWVRNEERRGWGLGFWELPRGEGEKPRGRGRRRWEWSGGVKWSDDHFFELFLCLDLAIMWVGLRNDKGILLVRTKLTCMQGQGGNLATSSWVSGFGIVLFVLEKNERVVCMQGLSCNLLNMTTKIYKDLFL